MSIKRDPRADPKPVKTQCFRCNGTGNICDMCGESESVQCDCEDQSYSECPDCEGSGE